jgi:nucleotide-binding universal stress UspA family protein
VIKRILVPLDPSPYTKTAVRIGCAMAKRTGAELGGLAVLDIPGIEKSVGPVPLGGLHYAEHLEEHKEQEAHERIRALLHDFATICKEEEIPHHEAEGQGSPVARIHYESMFYDLVITGLRTHFHFETEKKDGEPVDKILDHAVTPVLAVPPEFPATDIVADHSRVLVAFDGSFPAARALQRFVQLGFPGTAEVNLLTSDPDKEKADVLLSGAMAYLRAHGFGNVKKQWIATEIFEGIRDHGLDRATLLVVGAHAKKGLFDFKLGGLTQRLIREVEKPILIGQ